MPNGKCRGCELHIEWLQGVNKFFLRYYKDQATRYANEFEVVEAQLASEKEKDTIARFEPFEAGNS